MEDSGPSTLSLSAAFIVVVFAGIFINAYLFRIYGAESDREGVRGWRSWARNMEFSPEALGGFSYRHLALVSILGLFLELMMIRWISSEIRVFTYFKNFVLIACFGAVWMSMFQLRLYALCYPSI